MIATTQQRCLPLLCALLFQQSHLFWSVWCWRTMIPGKIFTGFAKFQGIVSVNDFRLPIWLQELLQASLCFLRSFCFLHGYEWIHWVAKSCTTIAYRWLFPDSQLSLNTLWSAVIKSPKFSARGTAPPLRLLLGALAILVLSQISQFRSLGKWVSTLCLPKSSLLLDVGSKNVSLEELACESLCSGTLSSTRFSLNSCSHSGISELNGAGFAANNGSPRSVISSTFWSWHRHWRGIDSTLVLSFSSLTVAWCCRSWWRRRAWGRCRMMTLLSWRCHWGRRMRTGGWTRWQAWNHDKNEVLRVALYPNTVF